MSESEIRMEGQEPEAFEVQLSQALRRVDVPEGFAARVMERTAEQGTRVQEIGPPPQRASALTGDSGPGRPKVVVMRSRFAALSGRAWVGGAVAAMLVLGLFGAEQMHVQREHMQAQQQFETATRITDQALEHTRQQLARAGVLNDME